MSEQALLNKLDAHKQIEDTPRTNILNATHRCDKCSAAAYVRVPLNVSDTLPEGGYLQFCGHHFTRNEMGLIPLVAGKIIDERYKLEQNKLVGTENS